MTKAKAIREKPTAVKGGFEGRAFSEGVVRHYIYYILNISYFLSNP